MGLQIRDERQMKALTGLSQAQFDSLLPVFSDIYRVTQQQTYEEGIQSGTRRRHLVNALECEQILPSNMSTCPLA
jgi:hypothetical protein